jgi:excisionase family DNA binding protein
MTTHVVRFAALSERERQAASTLPRLAEAEHVELRVRGAGGERAVTLPTGAATAVEALLTHLLRGERVAVLAEGQELSPNEAAEVLGISRPLIVHRMDVGDLPFRYIGKHRRARLEDVLALKARLEAQQAALAALAEDSEDLIARHGL